MILQKEKRKERMNLVTRFADASGLWLLGHVRHDSHWSESGFLAGEAALNSLVMVEGLKYSLGRQRPFQGNGSGAFFQGGTSFPSEHAAAAWAVAGVLAHEYPGPLTKVLAYGLAGAVSYSRVRGRQHFPSDVFVGGMMGNLVAQEIYARHHDTELGGAAWRSLGEIVRGDGGNSPSRSGSPYVPLDSWVYPTLDRLAALGVIHNEFLGMRPWTRLECARLVEEAEDGTPRVRATRGGSGRRHRGGRTRRGRGKPFARDAGNGICEGEGSPRGRLESRDEAGIRVHARNADQRAAARGQRALWPNGSQ